MTALPRVVVVSGRHVRAWPLHRNAPTGADPFTVMPMALNVALTRDFVSDAHVQLVTADRRLSSAACEVLDKDVAAVALALDVDTQGHSTADDAWWADFAARAGVLAEQHPGAFAYRTRGGARLVWTLEVPCVIRSLDDARAWRDRYQRTAAHVYRVAGIVADPACADWTRLYRLPHATRDEGGRPERLDTIGDAHAIQPWRWPAVVAPSVDLATARELAEAAPGWGAVAKRWARELEEAIRPTAARVTASLAGATRRDAYARAALDGAAQEIASAGKGARNSTANAEAYAIGRLVGAGVVPLAEAERVLGAAADSVATNGDERAEFRGAVRRGLDDGAKRPREIPDRPTWNAPPVGLASDTSAPADGAPAEPPDPFASHWRTLAAHGLDLSAHPPRREWLLEVDGEGALPMGKCGVLAAGGGTGKTIALVQLALAVATGGLWLDRFAVTRPGRVLVALAEEDIGEVHRRFYRAACAMGLDRDARALAAQRIVALPLAGTPVALTAKDERGNVTTAPALEALRARLAADTWSLLILDPLARWAGDDTEKDNAAATRFVQAIETLTAAPGSPTVLVAHHSSKSSVSDGAANVRGASGLVDAFRWAATMDKIEGDNVRGVRLHLSKTNYTRPWPDVLLTWSDDEHATGSLVLANATQQEALARASRQADADEADTRRKRAEALQDSARAKLLAEQRKASKAQQADTPRRSVWDDGDDS